MSRFCCSRVCPKATALPDSVVAMEPLIRAVLAGLSTTIANRGRWQTQALALEILSFL